MKVFLMLGKVGDILSVAPILHQQFVSTGEKPKLLVSFKYRRLLESFHHIDPIVYPGEFSDLTGAVKAVKSNGNEAVVLQVYGKDFPVRKLTPSFQLDQWLRADVAQHFNDWPLVIDGRNKNRENVLVRNTVGKRPFILFADYSESSPLLDKNILAASLQSHFGETHDIIRLSTVLADHFCDLVGLYNKASALVTIETSHLHLSRASCVPVFALITDHPSRWHGSAWHPRMRFQTRYSNWQSREREMFSCLSRTLTGVLEKNVDVFPTYYRNGYNPSIVEGSDVVTYRYHPEKNWKTRLAVQCGPDHADTIKFPSQFDEFSHEDARLFWFRGKLHISFVMAMSEAGKWKCVVGYGELVRDESGWSVPQLYFPKYGLNNWGALEKNWVFFEHDSRLYFIYGNHPEQQIVQVENDRAFMPLRSKSPEWNFGDIRGGCLVPYKGNLIRFFHSHTTSGPRDSWVYSIGVAIMENQPPFKTVSVSQFPVVSANEEWAPDCHHWKQNIVFPGGAQRQDSGWKLAYGFNDFQSRFVYINPNHFNL